MACTFCDAPVPWDARFCPNCGEAVAQRNRRRGAVGKLAVDPPYLESSAPPASAVVSLVFGILSWTLLPLVGAFVAVVTGHHARREIRERQASYDGWGLATAGLVLGYLQVIPILIVVVVVLAALAVAGIAAVLGVLGSQWAVPLAALAVPHL
jgi:hypothetical protein